MKHTLEWILTRAVAEVIVKDELLAKLRSGRPLRLKQGFDPSKPDLHIGHAVGLRKLRQLQDIGHQVILIVGDWTAQIGDPSGRDESRTMLMPDEVKANAQTYMDQFFHIVDKSRTEVRWQSEWYGKFTLSDVFNLTSRFTLAQLMAHETFRKRWDSGSPLTLMELMYPLLQAYDSIAIEADVEFGGMDQKFNNLFGRELQSMLGQRPQDVFLVPLLPGLDGRKMSKSYGNTVDLILPPEDMYGKLMSISDDMLMEYLTLVTDIPDDELARIEADLRAGTVNPRDVKMRLGREVVGYIHSPEAAARAEEEFIRVFQRRELPTDMPEFAIPSGGMNIVDLIKESGLSASKGDARRLVQQGGVRLDDTTIGSIDHIVEPKEAILQVGKRRFLRLRSS
jgi:tyrosyl-tRNA synthetase